MRLLAVGGVALFWVTTVVAGALAPGYSARADYISSLAGRGSSVAPLGIAAIAVLGCAHLAAAAALRRRDGDRGGGRAVLPVALAVAGVAGLAIAAFRVGCPQGAGGCGADDVTPPDLLDVIHGHAVAGYELAVLVAMAAVALRAGSWLVRAGAAVAAVASVLLLAQTFGADAGAWQRAWLTVNTGWLVLLVGLRGGAASVSGGARRAS